MTHPATATTQDLGRLVLVLDCKFPIDMSPDDAQAIVGLAMDAARDRLEPYLENAWVAANDGARGVLALVPEGS